MIPSSHPHIPVFFPKAFTMPLRLALCLLLLLTLGSGQAAAARNRVYTPQVRSLVTVVNQDWLSPPVMRLHSDDVLHLSFDELSHTYHRFVYRIEHCEADWTPSTGLFESDYLQGFNGLPIEDYENSRGTTVLYTHYRLDIPNEQCRLTLSGNYRLTVYDEDNDMEKVLEADFMVSEESMALSLNVSSNTDIDNHKSHQQASMKLAYGQQKVSHLEEQIYTVVTQNDRQDNQVVNPRPNYISQKGLEWNHQRALIFDAGNEYRKFEVLAVSHPTLGVDRMWWDGEAYHAYLFQDEPRKNYLSDEDANGAFYLRNSDNFENDITSDYVWVHYQRLSPTPCTQGSLQIDGWWTTDADRSNYRMEYDEESQCYHATLLQKQGYYSYQYLYADSEGQTRNEDSEGNYYQTENKYQAYVYFREIGGRAWRLAAYRQYRFDAH